MNEIPKTYSIKQAAAALEVHTNTVYRWVKGGAIKSVRVGPKLIRIPASEITQLLEAEKRRYDDAN